MTDQQYTIAPLVWEKRGGEYRADSILGNLVAWMYCDPMNAMRFPWTCKVETRGGIATIAGDMPTLESAQFAAESWYHDRLRPALREVTNGRTTTNHEVPR